MTIRRQLTLLVAAVAVPLIALASVATTRLWTLQRDAHEQRYLERVSAMRLSLDTEFDGTIRLLAGLGGTGGPGLPGPSAAALADRFTQLLRTHPEWAVLGFADPGGRSTVTVSRTGEPSVPPPPADLLRRTTVPTVTDLINLPDGRHVAYVLVPVDGRDNEMPGWLYVGETSDDWLRFLRRYPISPDTILTIFDRNGRIVARTQEHARFVGGLSAPAFLERSRRDIDGSFETVSLDGTDVYAAFSRSRVSTWTVGTGVPSASVEAALRQSTIGIVVGIVATALLVVVLGASIGTRIIRALSRLADEARLIGTAGEASGDDSPLPVKEAESVRQALRRAGDLIAAREAESAAALAREAQARAGAEQVSASKDEFIAMLGHELRNPLSALKSASTLLAMPTVPAAVKERSHQIIERQIGRLTDLVDDMLDVARLDSGKIVLNRRRLDLAAVVSHVVDSFNAASRCSHLQVATDLDPVWVDGDETRLEQITANLLDNACKYTPQGGHIWLATRRLDDRAVLEVRDDGSGISGDLLPRVFEVFSQGQRTLARAEGGLGLGLTVVRRLAALHGGHVSAASEGEGRGATFRLELPACEPAAPPPPAPPTAPVASDAYAIVVVEDDPENRELYELLLEEEGHRVVLAPDGEAGVAAILRERPDAAIIDIGLPGIDGFEVARRVRQALEGAPQRPRMVAVTGYGTPADREKAIAAGFDAFLRKPFDLDAFLAIMKKPAS